MSVIINFNFKSNITIPRVTLLYISDYKMAFNNAKVKEKQTT